MDQEYKNLLIHKNKDKNLIKFDKNKKKKVKDICKLHYNTMLIDNQILYLLMIKILHGKVLFL